MTDAVFRKLAAAGIPAGDDPGPTWLRLHHAIGRRATLIDRYELEASALGVAVADLSFDDRVRMQMEVLPVLFPGWSRTGEASPIDPIVVADYDPAWKERFELKRRCLAIALHPLDVVIEHIGSTAVPGLAAKPVIDIMVAVPDVEDEVSYVAAIESCGVSCRSRDDGHRYFKPLPPATRTVQIHVVDQGSAWQRDHILFRDYVRAHPEAARQYGDLKKKLAITHRQDRLAYNAAKTDFILDHMEIAKRWGQTSS